MAVLASSASSSRSLGSLPNSRSWPVLNEVAVTQGMLTEAVVFGLEAFAADNGVALEWRTASEAGTIGFDLYRRSAEGRWVLSSNVDSQRLFDEELDGLGFQLKEWPWHWGREQLLLDLCQNRRVACDRAFGDAKPIADRLCRLL